MEDTDILLMQRIKSGDVQSFDELFERHHKRVLNIIYKYIGNKQSAEDLVQEVFLRVYKSRHSYKPTAKFTTWLYTIVKNLCFKEFRKSSQKIYSIEANAGNSEIKSTQYFFAKGGSVYGTGLREEDRIRQDQVTLPSEIIEKEEITRRIKEVIEGLPPKQRIAVILNKYECLSYQEIADSIGISIKAVKSLLCRARINIKDKLSAYVDINK